MSKVFVTGPDGLLGSNIVRELLDRKYEVRVMLFHNRKPITLIGLPIEFVYGNIWLVLLSYLLAFSSFLAGLLLIGLCFVTLFRIKNKFL